MRKSKPQAKVGSNKCFPPDFFKSERKESSSNIGSLETNADTEESYPKQIDQ